MSSPLFSELKLLLACCGQPRSLSVRPSQESLVIDTPRVRKQTRHYNSFEDDELMEFSELDSDSEERPCRSRRLAERSRRFLRAECFRVEKNLLIFGYRWNLLHKHVSKMMKNSFKCVQDYILICLYLSLAVFSIQFLPKLKPYFDEFRQSEIVICRCFHEVL